MSDEDDPLTAVVEETIAKRNRPQRMHRAIWRLNQEQGMSANDIARAIQEALYQRGWSAADLKHAGVGYDNIRTILRKPPPEEGY